IKKVIQQFSEQLNEHNIQLSTNICPGVEVNCDSFRIEQVISNLLSNAISYGENTPIHISLQMDLKWAYFKITNKGRGITDPERERIFECFGRGSNATGSKGLRPGLFIGQQIIRGHGGE